MTPTQTFVLCAAAAAVGCGGSPADPTRFLNQRPVSVVNDRILGKKPDPTPTAETLYHYDQLVHRRLTRLSELPVAQRALNVNSMGEVPDSTWFTNRIGARELSPHDVWRGPLTGVGPEQSRPWKVIGTKVGGKSAGLLIEDRAGKRYILKFDRRGFPEMETSAEVVVDRLLWALGYNVPEDEIVTLIRSDLLLADDAKVENAFGDERPMRKRDLDRVLARIDIPENGRIRGLASELVPGQPIGGFVDEGVRKQDPNDRIPHQHRRDLRGLGAIFSWLKHTDVKTSNTLDAWVEQAGTSGLGYVVHYQLDFGNALGVRAWQGEIGDDGYSYVVDPRPMALNLVTLGIATHRWEERRPDRRYGLGLFETDHFDPAAYKGRVPYLPIELMDRFDALWATRLVAALTPQHIAAAVAAAELSDRRVAAELTHALVVRQRKLAAYWFSKANPLDRFEVVPGDGGRAQLCFDDLLLRYKLSGTPTRYRAVGYDHAGDPTGRTWVASPDRDGRACVADIRPSSAPDGYTIIRIETWRDGHEHDHGPVLVHLALDPEQMLRPIGVRRQ